MGGSVSKTQEGCRILTLVSFTILQSNRLCMEKFKLNFALEVKMLLHECQSFFNAPNVGYWNRVVAPYIAKNFQI